MPVDRVFLAALLLCAGSATAARADLAKYIQKAEPEYSWKLKDSRTSFGARVYELELVSQTWQKITWKHDLMVVVPPKVEPKETMFLWNQGGKPGVSGLLMALDLATKMRAPVAFLYGIPNQPLLGGKKEDALIAETFVQYLETKDDTWPLLFPMVKSLVKAMDALQAFAKKEWKKDVKQFVVSGASKRGWTTWLTGASDPRVKAIVPMVIDTLNMQKQLPYQLESYGAYSDMIRDYTNRKLVPLPKTPEALRLWGMVDPWSYRKKLTMPKMIINGSNDPYWTQDALNLYWDDLNGAKYVLYVPNAGHDLMQRHGPGKADRLRVSNTASAFARAQIEGKAMPKLTWKHAEECVGGKYRLTVECDAEAKAARLWQADAPTRDFRKARWTEKELKLGKDNAAVAEVEAPASGCRVFFAEYEYDLDGLRYHLSTQMRIIGKPEAKKKEKE